MRHGHRFLPVLAIVFLVLVAGCLNGGPPSQPPENTLQITPPECTAAGHACTDVRQGEPVRIRWDVQYNDEQPITIQLNKGDRDLGFGVLQNFCTIFDASKSEFTATRVSPFVRDIVSDQDTVTLQDAETLRFEWEFLLRDTDISELGAACNPRFRITYTHTVNGSKQVQVRENRQVPRVSDLNVNLESPSPVKPRIQGGDVFQAGDPIFAEIYLENTGQGEITHVDYLEADLTRGTGDRVNPQAPECRIANPSNKNTNIFVLSTGPRRGQTSRLECGPDHGFNISQQALAPQRSNTFTITMASTYTYEQEVGRVHIGVAPSE